MAKKKANKKYNAMLRIGSMQLSKLATDTIGLSSFHAYLPFGFFVQQAGHEIEDIIYTFDSIRYKKCIAFKLDRDIL